MSTINNITSKNEAQNSTFFTTALAANRVNFSRLAPRGTLDSHTIMPLQNTSDIAPLSDADFALARSDAAALLDKVRPLLRHFAPEAIQAFTKYGDKSDAFVQEADAAVTAVGDALPRAFNAQDFHNTVLVMHQLETILGPVGELFDGLTDAKQFVGSALMQNSNFVYAQLRAVENLDPRVVPYVQEMAKRYADNGRKKAKPAA